MSVSSQGQMKRLVIVQPYVPSYRRAFFEGLSATLASKNIDCKIASSEPRGASTARGDGISAEWIVPAESRRLSIGSRSLDLGGTMSTWKDADAVILGSQGSSVDVYRALLLGRTNTRAPKVGLWGHIRDYVNSPHPVDRSLEKWQLRRADHVFAYTASGSEYARSLGVNSARITTVMNSIDTSELHRASASLSDDDVTAFVESTMASRGRTLSFIGGLDESKRIDFLASALDKLWNLDPTIRLLVAGNGSQRSLLNNASARGQVVHVGYADAKTKALMARVSGALVMPGRIGLVAVDAMALGIPILTTAWPYHAPEAEYLTEDLHRFTVDNDPHSFAAAMQKAAAGALGSTRQDQMSEAVYPNLETMVQNFATGVLDMLNHPRRWKPRRRA